MPNCKYYVYNLTITNFMPQMLMFEPILHLTQNIFPSVSVYLEKIRSKKKKCKFLQFYYIAATCYTSTYPL